MNPLVERIALSLVPPVMFRYIRFLRWTMKIEYRNREALERAREGPPGQYILAFWHSRFLLMPYAYPDDRIAVMSSWSRDSEMLVRTLRRFGFAFSRGSSTRGGTAALRGMVKLAADGYDVGVTPDGPRGPRRRVQPGVVAVARFTGLPIVPVAFSAVPARRVGSWDRLLVPRAFSRGLFLYDEPIRVPRKAERDEQERFRVLLEQTLDRITDAVDRETGIGPEEPRPPVES